MRTASGNPQRIRMDIQWPGQAGACVGTSTALEAVDEFSQRSRDFDDAASVHVV
jgi:hypothetical protein